jgi:ABC-2 type transport system ATP-binding protein
VAFLVPRMESIIHLKDVSKEFKTKTKKPGLIASFKSMLNPTYKKVKAVDKLSFDIKKGEIVGFIGPNGAGKSTTIKMLSGILFPSSGHMTVLGMNPQEDRVKLAYRIGTIFGQKQQLSMHLPARDSFDLFAKIYEIDEKIYEKRRKELVSLFEIEELMDVPVRKLSLGERMRCEFVASLLHKPDILFLDEPTIGLDIIAKKKMREFIKKLNEKEKTTIILTSHDIGDIEELCPRILLINHGKLIYDGSMNSVKSKIKNKILELYFEEPPKKIESMPFVKILHKEPYKLVLEINRTKTSVRKVLDKYLANNEVADIVVEDPPIEEIIEELYRK